MTEQVSNKIRLLKETIFGEKKYAVCHNNIEVSGWIIQKPNITQVNGNTSINWILYLINGSSSGLGYSTVIASSFTIKVIEELQKNLKCVSAIVMIGRFLKTRRDNLIFVATDVKIVYKMLDMELEEPVKLYNTKGDKKNENNN